MKTELVKSLTETFEGHAQQTEVGVEYWLGRDLQHLLGYAEWRNFGTVLTRAKTACELSGRPVADHFVDVAKMVDLGSGSRREVDDVMLTRYACFNARQHRMGNESAISREHITNNEAVRKTLLERGIRPEALPPAEDVKKTERRLAAEDKKSLKNPDALDH